MRNLSLFFCFLITVVQANGQSVKDIHKPTKSVNLEPTFEFSATALLPIQKVVVIDSRFDTTKLGYFREEGSFKKLTTSTAFSLHIEERLNKAYAKHLSDTSKNVLYLFIKHLWVQQTTFLEESGNKLVHYDAQTKKDADGIKIHTNTQPIVVSSAQVECYIERNSGFQPLFRLDTQFVKYKSFRKVADELVMLPFQTIMDKLTPTTLYKKRKMMNWNEVVAFDNRWKQAPRIVKDTMPKGIYLTFADFLANKITKKNFEIQLGDLTDELYVIENGDKKLLHQFWGYSDGEKQYIHTSFNFFELERVGATYEFIGIKGLLDEMNPATMSPASGSPADLLSAGIIGILSHRNKVSGNVRRLQLNMETGKPY